MEAVPAVFGVEDSDELSESLREDAQDRAARSSAPKNFGGWSMTISSPLKKTHNFSQLVG